MIQSNRDSFYLALVAAYTKLFADDAASYAGAIQRGHTPETLASKMTVALACGQGMKDGHGVTAACKALAIPHTHDAIRAFLTAGAK